MKPLSHLDRLEAESLHIFREVASEFSNPVLLYSIGKDSTVLLHLMRKAFFPARPPIPLLHIDSTFEFAETYRFRDAVPSKYGVELRVHINEEGVKAGIVDAWKRHGRRIPVFHRLGSQDEAIDYVHL